MTKILVLQMDAPERLKPATDSTLALALVAQKRGYEVFYYTPPQLACVEGEIVARVCPISFRDRMENFFVKGDIRQMSLEKADVILVRQDPPYNMEYLSATWLLERLKHPRIFNNPTAIRNRPEKLFPLEFPHYTPPTCISADMELLTRFYEQHGRDVVMKPLYGFGGADIRHFTPETTSQQFEEALSRTLSQSQEPLLLQPFLPEVMTQEKRIILINGHVAAAYNRIPAEGDFRSNAAVGGSAAPTTLTPRQREIAEAVGKVCAREGLMLVGLDVIGDWLIEINVTCPTGLRIARRLYGADVAEMFWDEVEKA